MDCYTSIVRGLRPLLTLLGMDEPTVLYKTEPDLPFDVLPIIQGHYGTDRKIKVFVPKAEYHVNNDYITYHNIDTLSTEQLSGYGVVLWYDRPHVSMDIGQALHFQHRRLKDDFIPYIVISSTPVTIAYYVTDMAFDVTATTDRWHLQLTRFQKGSSGETFSFPIRPWE